MVKGEESMLLNPLGQVLFMEISKRFRDLKWTVDDQDFHKEEAIHEAAYLLPSLLADREEDEELEKKVVVLAYEGTQEQFNQNEIDGISITFYRKRLKALHNNKEIGAIKLFQEEKNDSTIRFFIDKPFADDEVKQFLTKLFDELSATMEEIYGESKKDIPIVLLPSKLQELPIYNSK